MQCFLGLGLLSSYPFYVNVERKSPRFLWENPWLQGLGPTGRIQSPCFDWENPWLKDIDPVTGLLGSSRATPTRKTGYNGWNPRNGETHIISKHL